MNKPTITRTPNEQTRIEVYESDDFYTVFMNGMYAIGFDKKDAAAYDRVNTFVGGMVKQAELTARAAEDAAIARAAAIREARRARAIEAAKLAEFGRNNR